jgi:hypothetical protein
LFTQSIIYNFGGINGGINRISYARINIFFFKRHFIVMASNEQQLKLLSPLRAVDQVIISAEGVREVIISADEQL